MAENVLRPGIRRHLHSFTTLLFVSVSGQVTAYVLSLQWPFREGWRRQTVLTCQRPPERSTPTFTYMTRCDGCGQCVDICPSDIMHIDTAYRRSYNIEPNFCWECYSCVKACPQHAIDVRGYADFAPLGHSVRVLREEANGTISWKIRYRDGRVKEFTFPIRTTPWGSIKAPFEYEALAADALSSQLLAHEPASLGVENLPTLPVLKKKEV